MERTLVVGAGIFGVTAAIELRQRGHAVRLVDPGPLPHPLAASTDISKVVRLEYGADDAYTALAEESIEGWRRWNRDFGVALYHETGLLLLRRDPLAAGSLEQDSFEVVAGRGHRPELLDAVAVRARFPAWNADVYRHGTYDPEGGFVESGRVVSRLVEEARNLGVEVREGVSLAGCSRLHRQEVCPLGSPGSSRPGGNESKPGRSSSRSALGRRTRFRGSRPSFDRPGIRSSTWSRTTRRHSGPDGSRSSVRTSSPPGITAFPCIR